MRNLAPAVEPVRSITPIRTFDWRLQTGADAADFSRALNGAGEWQRISLPHYGGPIGKATAYYRTTFELDLETLTDPHGVRRALFVRFKGVDYKAHVFVNGAYLGSHEGFFAPFEFEFTPVARQGENTLLVKVENDAICMGNDSWGNDGARVRGRQALRRHRPRLGRAGGRLASLPARHGHLPGRCHRGARRRCTSTTCSSGRCWTNGAPRRGSKSRTATPQPARVAFGSRSSARTSAQTVFRDRAMAVSPARRGPAVN